MRQRRNYNKVLYFIDYYRTPYFVWRYIMEWIERKLYDYGTYKFTGLRFIKFLFCEMRRRTGRVHYNIDSNRNGLNETMITGIGVWMRVWMCGLFRRFLLVPHDEIRVDDIVFLMCLSNWYSNTHTHTFHLPWFDFVTLLFPFVRAFVLALLCSIPTSY